MKIELTRELDLIDDCNWAEWECRWSPDNGATWRDGVVQSDGHLIAEDTLTDENGNFVAGSAKVLDAQKKS